MGKKRSFRVNRKFLPFFLSLVVSFALSGLIVGIKNIGDFASLAGYLFAISWGALSLLSYDVFDINEKSYLKYFEASIKAVITGFTIFYIFLPVLSIFIDIQKLFFRFLIIQPSWIISVLLSLLLLYSLYIWSNHKNRLIFNKRIRTTIIDSLLNPDITISYSELVDRPKLLISLTSLMEDICNIAYHSSIALRQLITMFEKTTRKKDDICISSWLLLPKPNQKYFENIHYHTHNPDHKTYFSKVKTMHKPKKHNPIEFDKIKYLDKNKIGLEKYYEEISLVTSAAGWITYDAKIEEKDCVAYVSRDIEKDALYFNHQYKKYLKPEHMYVAHQSMIAYAFKITDEEYGVFFIFSNFKNYFPNKAPHYFEPLLAIIRNVVLKQYKDKYLEAPNVRN